MKKRKKEVGKAKQSTSIGLRLTPPRSKKTEVLATKAADPLFSKS
jgi:hypothetical protein